jgi:hypothetical protein
MATLIESIFVSLPISRLTSKEVQEANFYIDFLIANEWDEKKRQAYYLLKIKILRRMVNLELRASRKAKNRRLQKHLTPPPAKVKFSHKGWG